MYVCVCVAAPPDVSAGAGAAGGLLRAGSSRLDNLRSWGVSTYKCTKQLLYEKLGKTSRTVDTGKPPLNPTNDRVVLYRVDFLKAPGREGPLINGDS